MTDRRLFAMYVLLLAAALPAAGQANPPEQLRVGAAWRAGEKQTYRVQQVVKERAGGAEETRFLANGTLEITAVESTPDAVTFTWHRRMDNAEFELAREPWGIRGNVPYEKLLRSTVNEGLPLRVRLDLRTHRARVGNLDELGETLSRRLQSIGAESSANLTGRSRLSTPDERGARDPSAAGIHRPLVRYDSTKYANTPRNGKVVATWYARLSAAEIEDLLAFLGGELRLDTEGARSSTTARVYRPTSADEVLVTMITPPTAPRPAPATAPEPIGAHDETQGEPRQMGLAGGAMAPVARDAKIEVNLASGWPMRAAIMTTEDDGAKRATLRRVYLRQ